MQRNRGIEKSSLHLFCSLYLDFNLFDYFLMIKFRLNVEGQEFSMSDVGYFSGHHIKAAGYQCDFSLVTWPVGCLPSFSTIKLTFLSFPCPWEGIVNAEHTRGWERPFIHLFGILPQETLPQEMCQLMWKFYCQGTCRHVLSFRCHHDYEQWLHQLGRRERKVIIQAVPPPDSQQCVM